MEALEFRITCARITPEVFVASIVGELDLLRKEELEQALGRGLDSGSSRVVFDLLKMTFIDSTALGILSGGARKARPLGVELVLVPADPNGRRLLQITGLDRLFTVEHSLARALDVESLPVPA